MGSRIVNSEIVNNRILNSEIVNNRIKGKPRMLAGPKGFTLIEVIGVIIVGGIMFSMMVAYMNRSFTQSALPVVRLGQTMALTRVAEQITQDYIRDRSPANLAAISANLAVSPNNPYGDGFSVATNQFVTFSANNDVPDLSGSNTSLKITIQHDETNEKITLLLTAW